MRTKRIVAVTVINIGMFAGAILAHDFSATLSALKDYDFASSDRGVPRALQAEVYVARDGETKQRLAAEMAAMLKQDVSVECKRFLCRQLSLVASEQQLPVLLDLLDDEELAFDARFALERMPGAAVGSALCEDMRSRQGKAAAGLLHSLGQRGDVDCIPAIAARLRDPDDVVASAAIDALGTIGGERAAEALTEARAFLRPNLARVLNDALLRAADGLAAGGRQLEAARIYESLTRADAPVHVRTAAFGGLLNAADDTGKVMDEALRGKDGAALSAALAGLARRGTPDMLALAVDNMDAYAAREQALVLWTVAVSTNKAALPAAVRFMNAEDVGVRRAAIAAVGVLGDSASVAELMKLAGPEEDAVFGALAAMPADGTDAALMEQLAKGTEPARRMAAKALGERRCTRAVPALLRSAASDPDEAVRGAAVKALGMLADAGSCRELAAIGARSTDTLQLESASALVRICKRHPDAVGVLVAEAEKAAPVARILLLNALGGVLDERALPAFYAGLKDGDPGVRKAAVLALGKWNDTDGPLDKLLETARTEDDDVVKALALRAVNDLLLHAARRDRDGAARRYEQALASCDRKEEKALLMGTLAGVHTPPALELAVRYTDDEDIGEISAATAKAIANRLGVPVPPKTSVSPKGSGPVRPVALSWRVTPNAVALLNGEKVVWRHCHDKAEGKPYLHPLGTVHGDALTWLRPKDHPWHRALWFSWKYINGVNYWEESAETGMSAGLTELRSVDAATKDDFSARIEMSLSYHPPEKAELMSEKRLIAISAPDKSGCYTVDWTSTFKATGGDVELDRTPIPGEQGSRAYGGYAGVSIRMARETRGWTFTDSEGRTGKAIHGKDARWVDAAGKTASGSNAGVAIFDHPANMRHPSPWYLSEDMPYFSPAVLFNEPLTLKQGESFLLKYRVLVHPGGADQEKLNAEFKAFGKE